MVTETAQSPSPPGSCTYKLIEVTHKILVTFSRQEVFFASAFFNSPETKEIHILYNRTA